MAEPTVHILTINDQKDAKRELNLIGADPNSYAIMAPKMQHVNIKIKDLDVRAANVLKQEMLSKGAEAAVAKWASSFSEPTTDVILMATIKQYRLVLKKMKAQPFGLSKLVEPITRVLASFAPLKAQIACGRHNLKIGKKTLVMGILNVTTDSFSEQGSFLDPKLAIAHAKSMVADGADIIDIGGESTRPGARPVTATQEMKRVMPVIESLADKINIPISIDTSKAKVAEAAINAGAAMVNDVTALTKDKKMAATCAAADVAVILMHMRGQPLTMQDNPTYDDLLTEVIAYLGQRVAAAERAGIDSAKIMVDPGIGFSKTVAHNLEIIKRLREVKSLGLPVVIGTSRKSMIGKILGGLEPLDRVEGTAATVTAAILNGADIVRVHDVKEMVRVAKMADAIVSGGHFRG